MTGTAGEGGEDVQGGRSWLEELVRAKRPEPVRSVEELMAPGVFADDDEVDEFVTAVRQWREADLS